jgi:hypothetical protein
MKDGTASFKPEFFVFAFLPCHDGCSRTMGQMMASALSQLNGQTRQQRVRGASGSRQQGGVQDLQKIQQEVAVKQPAGSSKSLQHQGQVQASSQVCGS